MLGFAAFVFFGLSGMFLGNLLLPAILVIFGVFVIVYSLLRMCKAKTEVDRQGIKYEIIFGIIILIVMMCGATPISNVVGALNDQEKYQQNVDSTVAEVENLPLAYRAYVDDRVESYRDYLDSLDVWSPEYKEILEDIVGNTKSEKIDNLCRSLARRLVTQDMDSVEKARSEWLHSLEGVNAFTQRTVSMAAGCGMKWMSEYREMSSVMFLGEETQPFDMPEMKKKLSKLGGYANFLKPGFAGIVIVLMCFALILLPYYMIRRSAKGKGGTHR